MPYLLLRQYGGLRGGNEGEGVSCARLGLTKYSSVFLCVCACQVLLAMVVFDLVDDYLFGLRDWMGIRDFWECEGEKVERDHVETAYLLLLLMSPMGCR